jgi:hypothetical protein
MPAAGQQTRPIRSHPVRSARRFRAEAPALRYQLQPRDGLKAGCPWARGSGDSTTPPRSISAWLRAQQEYRQSSPTPFVDDDRAATGDV